MLSIALLFSVESAAADSLRPLGRELLALRGVDDALLAEFVDDQPLTPDEMEPLYRVLYAAGRLSPGDWQRSARAEQQNESLRGDPAEQRGQIVRLDGRLLSLDMIEPPGEFAERFELPRYYRCQMALRSEGDDDEAVVATVFARSIPRTWETSPPSEARVGCFAVFLKMAPGDDETTRPLFVCDRIAWYPDNVLGDLGMDFGLFDAVENRKPLSRAEREPFYQLLAAAGRAGTQELLRRTAGKSADVVPLFNEPDEQHGRLVALEGVARRAVLVRIGDPEIVERFGFDHYWEVELFTDDSQSNPLVCCVLQLPEGMPRGDRIYEGVRIPAFFFKSWAYRSAAQGNERRQLAPMLIGREPLWLPPATPPSNPYAAAIAGVAFLAALAGVWIAVWRLNRGDQEFRQGTLARKYDLEPGTSLNQLPLDAPHEPDFRAGEVGRRDD